MNAVVIVTIRAVCIAFWAMDGRDLLVAALPGYIFFSLVILYLGVQGVPQEESTLLRRCGCGYLTTFPSYIVFAAVSRALTVLISLIFRARARRRPCGIEVPATMAWRRRHRRDVRRGGFVAFVVNLAFFVLYVATANYTRLPLDELRKLGRGPLADAASLRRTPARRSRSVATVRRELRDARRGAERRRCSWACAAYTGPAPSAYEAQAANYKRHPPSLRNASRTSLDANPRPRPPQRRRQSGAPGSTDAHVFPRLATRAGRRGERGELALRGGSASWRK